MGDVIPHIYPTLFLNFSEGEPRANIPLSGDPAHLSQFLAELMPAGISFQAPCSPLAPTQGCPPSAPVRSRSPTLLQPSGMGTHGQKGWICPVGMAGLQQIFLSPGSVGWGCILKAWRAEPSSQIHMEHLE